MPDPSSIFEHKERSARSAAVALRLVEVMGLDNGVTFQPFRAQIIRLNNAVYSLIGDGLGFSEDDIRLIACGEESEAQAAYGKLYGFNTLQSILRHIFEGPHLT